VEKSAIQENPTIARLPVVSAYVSGRQFTELTENTPFFP
jgi:hypothetical protein